MPKPPRSPKTRTSKSNRCSSHSGKACATAVSLQRWKETMRLQASVASSRCCNRHPGATIAAMMQGNRMAAAFGARLPGRCRAQEAEVEAELEKIDGDRVYRIDGGWQQAIASRQSKRRAA